MFQSHKILTSLILFFSLVSLSKATNQLPPILDYYPKCQFKILDTIEVKVHVSNKTDRINGKIILNLEKVKSKTLLLLKSLQKSALSRGAEALILVDRKLKPSGYHSSKRGASLELKAKLISHCGDLTQDKDRAAPVNSFGQKVTRYPINSFEITPIDIAQKKPKPTIKIKHDVSFTDGVYGIKLGFNYQQVRDVLGRPSVELSILGDEKIIGYGRNHWFHFQFGKLVKIDTDSFLLTDDSLHRIPLHEVIDNGFWIINKLSSFNDSLSKVRSSLNLEELELENNALRLDGDDEFLNLKFSYSENPWSKKVAIKLTGFVLQSKSYRPHAIRRFDDLYIQNKIVEDAYLELQSSGTIPMEKLKSNLGKPVVQIQNKKNEEILIYNPQLLIQTKNSEVEHIHFSNKLMRLNRESVSSIKPWRFAGLYHGQVQHESKNQFSENGYEFRNVIEIDSDNYQMELTFEEIKGQKLLDALDVYIF